MQNTAGKAAISVVMKTLHTDGLEVPVETPQAGAQNEMLRCIWLYFLALW